MRVVGTILPGNCTPAASGSKIVTGTGLPFTFTVALEKSPSRSAGVGTVDDRLVALWLCR